MHDIVMFVEWLYAPAEGRREGAPSGALLHLTTTIATSYQTIQTALEWAQSYDSSPNFLGSPLFE